MVNLNSTTEIILFNVSGLNTTIKDRDCPTGLKE